MEQDPEAVRIWLEENWPAIWAKAKADNGGRHYSWTSGGWRRDRRTGTQEWFVDHPDEAVHDADRLVTALMSERGYPTKGFEQQARDLCIRSRLA
ncbi:hypothetical protein ACFC5Z_13070 [Streptomyces sp. NPDC056004]|uniref:hypothetical protein n=1 Tax=Streptomyces sp. NPDC056004 TaxID=3345677 RepID=UPI0035E10D81